MAPPPFGSSCTKIYQYQRIEDFYKNVFMLFCFHVLEIKTEIETSLKKLISKRNFSSRLKKQLWEQDCWKKLDLQNK